MPPVFPKDLLFGRMAVSRGFLTQTQLQDCVQFQKAQAAGCPLGLVMIDKGYLTAEQLQELVSAQKEAFQNVDPARLQKIEDSIFGQIAIRENMVDREDVNGALRDQAIAEETGFPRRLGELLVERGCMTPAQVEQVLAIQRRRILLCERCGAQFNVETMASGTKFKCGSCQALLEVPEVPASAETANRMPDLEAAVAENPFADGLPHSGAPGLMDLEATAPEAADLVALPDEESGGGAGKSTRELLLSLSAEDAAPPPAAETAEVILPPDLAPAAPPPEADEAAAEEPIEDRATIGLPDIRGIFDEEPEAPAPKRNPGSFENMQTIVLPAVGRSAGAPAPSPAPPSPALPPPPSAPVGLSLSDLDEDGVGIEDMRTMAMPAVGRREASAGPAPERVALEDMRTMAMPAVSAKPAGPEPMLRATCSCGRRISAPARMAGKSGKCPGCGKSVVLHAGGTVGAGAAPATPGGAGRPAAPVTASAGTAGRAKPGAGARPDTAARPAARARGEASAAAHAGECAWPVRFLPGGSSPAPDAGLRGAGTLTFSPAGLVFRAASRPFSALTWLGAPLALLAAGGAIVLAQVPAVPALAGGLVLAVVCAGADVLRSRRAQPTTLAVSGADVTRVDGDHPPRVVLEFAAVGRGAVTVTLAPATDDRAEMLRALKPPSA